MERDVEIEDMADIGDVETARGDVGGDQQIASPRCGSVERAMRAGWSMSPCRATALNRA
jgi:hypothetical protein